MRLLTFFPESQQPRQFTPLRERRQSANVSVQVINQFQFTPLREGRRFRARNAPTWSLFQFTPLREGRLILGLYLLADLIFQFTPLREGRLTGSAPVFNAFYFNSRPSARGDILPLYKYIIAQISIHAPPRGATAHAAQALARQTFQFTPLREGRRRTTGKGPGINLYFNSRPSARGDPLAALAGRWRFCYFNSRPSARGDVHDYGGARAGYAISIHAPPRGATPHICIGGKAHEFQFTPLREGRRQKICNFCKSFVQPLQISMA